MRRFLAALALDKNFDYAGPDRNLGLLYRDAPVLASIDSLGHGERFAWFIGEAIAALVQIRSSDAKDFLAAAARSPDFGGIVLSAMLQHSSLPSLQGTIQ